MTRKQLLSAPSLDDVLHAHLARFVAEVFDDHLDLAGVRSATARVVGPNDYSRLMARILLYGDMIGGEDAIVRRDRRDGELVVRRPAGCGVNG